MGLPLSCDLCPMEIRTVPSTTGGTISVNDPSIYKAKVDEIECELRVFRDRYNRLAAEQQTLQESNEQVTKERDILRLRYHESLAKLEHLGTTLATTHSGQIQPTLQGSHTHSGFPSSTRELPITHGPPNSLALEFSTSQLIAAKRIGDGDSRNLELQAENDRLRSKIRTLAHN